MAEGTVVQKPSAEVHDGTGNNANTTAKCKGFLFHPDLSWLDKLLSALMHIFIPYRRLYNSPITSPLTQETKDALQIFRSSVRNGNTSPFKSKLAQLEKDYSWGSLLITLSRKHDILETWGILQQVNENPDNSFRQGQESVPVLVFGPSRLLDPVNQTIAVETTADVPIIVWFHGGGMISGQADDNMALSDVRKMLEMTGGTNEDKSKRNVLLISVDYGLSPESPFPNAVIDGLSVVEHFANTYPSSSLHIAGISAGGNLSAVVTMESVRRYPGRVKSSIIIHPMLDPRANSDSYHSNARASMLHHEWMRWCWRAYLLETNENVSDRITASEHTQLIINCKWLNNSIPGNDTVWKRLINPVHDLPSASQMSKTKFFICAAKGDLLYDEGQEFAMACINRMSTMDPKSNNISYIETRGDHSTALLFDKQQRNAKMKSWSEHVFDAHNSS